MRKKHTNPNCQCVSCKSKRGELKGKNHPNYGKRYPFRLKRKNIKPKKQYYCKTENCNKEITKSSKSGFCKSCSHKGIVISKSHKLAISNTLRGRPLSLSHRKSISDSLKGELCYNWKGGISIQRYPREFYLKRDTIKKRDDYTCQICFDSEENELKDFKRKLLIHHKDFDKSNNENSNLVTLCVMCHLLLHNVNTSWVKNESNISR
ncbi:MAG: NUMOD3 domain-containing DNA-binding protein [Patescibacteria group bacterium]